MQALHNVTQRQAGHLQVATLLFQMFLISCRHSRRHSNSEASHVLWVLLQGDEDLLKVFLQYIRITCSDRSQATIPLLGPELASLLNGTKVVRPEIRHGALAAVYAAMTAAMHSSEVRSSLSVASGQNFPVHIWACAYPSLCQPAEYPEAAGA